jgi:predicted dehydrogenase
MPDRVKTGIIGLGKVAHMHAKALQVLPEADFAAVCSRSIGKAGAFAAQYHVRAYADVAEMVCREQLDVVIVCTPHPNHAAVTLPALRAGAHVLVEKPLASSLQDCDDMIQTARAYGRKLGMVCQRRFYPPVQRIRTAIDSGKIGRPILGTVNMLGWRDQAYYASDPWRGSWAGEGGGVLVNQAPHQLDLLQWFMGPADELFGYWANLNHPYIEVEDTAIAVIRFKNGSLGQIIVSNAQNPALFGKVHVHGSNGASIGVQTDGGAMFIAGMTGITEPPVNDLWTVAGESDRLAEWVREDTAFFHSVDAMQHFHERQDEDFLRAVRTDTKPLIDGEDGRRTVELFTAIYRSNRDGRPVRFPLLPEDEPDFDGRLKADQDRQAPA